MRKANLTNDDSRRIAAMPKTKAGKQHVYGGTLKFATFLVFLGFVLAGTLNAQAQQQSDPLAGFRPYLIGISVPDAQEAAAWYEQKLGFKRFGGMTSGNGTASIVVERDGIAVELLQFKDSFSIRHYRPDYNNDSGRLQGITKFAFAVNDLDAALAEVMRNNVHVIREITELKALGVKFFVIEDNNGNVIQIFQSKQSRPQVKGAVKP